MPYVMKPRHSQEIIAVNARDPGMQFPVPQASPPQLLATDAGDWFALLQVDAMNPGRWFYEPVEPFEVMLPPDYVMQNRAPTEMEMSDMDPAERAEWEDRTRDTPALEPQPLPSEA